MLQDLSSLINVDRATPSQIDAAYEYCRRVTQQGSKTFYFTTLFLPYPQRRAMWAAYNFCRATDDIVDRAENLSAAELCQKLDSWQITLAQAHIGHVPPNNLGMLAWYDAARSFDIPLYPPQELIEGVRMDLLQSRYTDFAQLRLYCYRVASTVGLLASSIIGYSDSAALDYAVDLGIAMQLTNILRDVGEDGRTGRIYLPQDEMASFGYSQSDLLRNVINDNFIELMRFQIVRARAYYRHAEAGIGYLTPNCQFAICMAGHLYEQILSAIEDNDYNVFTKRAFVPLPRKVAELGRIGYRRRFGDRSRYFVSAPRATPAADSGSDSLRDRLGSAADSGTPPSYDPGVSVSIDGGVRRVVPHLYSLLGRAEKEG